MPIRIIVCLIAAAAALSGCGRRGPLEPPPPEAGAISGQPAPAAEATQAAPNAPGSAALSDPASPGAAASRNQESPGAQEPAEAVPAEPSRRGFFLDPLL